MSTPSLSYNNFQLGSRFLSNLILLPILEDNFHKNGKKMAEKSILWKCEDLIKNCYMISVENSLVLIFFGTRLFFYWCSDGVVLGHNVSKSNWKFDLVAMTTAAYAIIPSTIWLNLKAMGFGNTKAYRFLHPFLCLFSYIKLTIWIFGRSLKLH